MGASVVVVPLPDACRFRILVDFLFYTVVLNALWLFSFGPAALWTLDWQRLFLFAAPRCLTGSVFRLDVAFCAQSSCVVSASHCRRLLGDTWYRTLFFSVVSTRACHV